MQVYSFLKDTELVQLERPTFGYPRNAIISFEKSGEAQPGTLLLLKNKATPVLWAIRVLDPNSDSVAYRSDGAEGPLELAEWDDAGWAFAWAARVGHAYPEWIMSEIGLRPKRS